MAGLHVPSKTRASVAAWRARRRGQPSASQPQLHLNCNNSQLSSSQQQLHRNRNCPPRFASQPQLGLNCTQLSASQPQLRLKCNSFQLSSSQPQLHRSRKRSPRLASQPQLRRNCNSSLPSVRLSTATATIAVPRAAATATATATCFWKRHGSRGNGGLDGAAQGVDAWGNAASAQACACAGDVLATKREPEPHAR